jgi:hypothetical protein
MSAWERYWAPEEYADLCECLTPQELEEELSRMQAKAEHYLAAAEMGFDSLEALSMRLRGMKAMHGERTS